MRHLGIVTVVTSALLSVAWYAESVICGRCFISTYLAPVAIVGNVVGAMLLARHDVGPSVATGGKKRDRLGG